MKEPIFFRCVCHRRRYMFIIFSFYPLLRSLSTWYYIGFRIADLKNLIFQINGCQISLFSLAFVVPVRLLNNYLPVVYNLWWVLHCGRFSKSRGYWLCYTHWLISLCRMLMLLIWCNAKILVDKDFVFLRYRRIINRLVWWLTLLLLEEKWIDAIFINLRT